MTQHAKLSPSSAHRWLECTPSARFEDLFPDKGSTYAAEGTLAHKISELKLAMEYLTVSGPDLEEIESQLSECRADELYFDAMEEHTDDYVAFVGECMAEMDMPVISLEQRYDMSEWVPEGFGTGDVSLIDKKLLWFIDLKYGQGKRVDAHENAQLKLYGLGALRAFEFLHEGIETVRMTIYQPRISNFSTFEMKAADLLRWADEELRPKALLAWEGKGEFTPGDHCQFCRGAHQCKALADKNMELARFEFLEANKLGAEEIAEILDAEDRFTSWLKSVTDYALDQAINHGVQWPGYKVVAGRANRKYLDELKVANKILNATELGPDDIYNTKVKGITELEKALGKKRFAELLSDLIHKPPGKPALVPESDNRPALNSAQAAAGEFQD